MLGLKCKFDLKVQYTLKDQYFQCFKCPNWPLLLVHVSSRTSNIAYYQLECMSKRFAKWPPAATKERYWLWCIVTRWRCYSLPSSQAAKSLHHPPGITVFFMVVSGWRYIFSYITLFFQLSNSSLLCIPVHFKQQWSGSKTLCRDETCSSHTSKMHCTPLK